MTRSNPNLPFDTTSYPTNPRFIDIGKTRYGKVFVDRYAGSRRGSTYWWCICDCGSTFVAPGRKVATGQTRSCGCLQSQVARRLNYKHGATNEPEYRAWAHMKSRCYNKNTVDYPAYGGRGITVCARWRNNYSAFLSDMGQRPTAQHSIDRIDNDGDYEPSNCRWATPKQQANNRRRPDTAHDRRIA